ncbi:MAG TPA: shikimate kinase [Pirellulales bacterium]|nr:shikimate kinase [Pirellulales bacterium]
MNIALIGYRGTGKTTIARQLALALGWDWIDADVEVELRAGKSIVEIFADDGEAAFRDIEAAVLGDLIGRKRTVIALGGGAVLRAENRQRLRRAGLVVWLQAEPETIAVRMAQDPTTASRRPDLTTAGGIVEIRKLLAERSGHYRECCGLAIATDDKSPADVTAEILARLPSAEARA